ncbi:hypothetical protein EON67_06590 [archaeon]|nr:MAG: hypothetical protein EON67_06590 [archaeon]
MCTCECMDEWGASISMEGACVLPAAGAEGGMDEEERERCTAGRQPGCQVSNERVHATVGT